MAQTRSGMGLLSRLSRKSSSSPKKEKPGGPPSPEPQATQPEPPAAPAPAPAAPDSYGESRERTSFWQEEEQKQAAAVSEGKVDPEGMTINERDEKAEAVLKIQAAKRAKSDRAKVEEAKRMKLELQEIAKNTPPIVIWFRRCFDSYYSAVVNCSCCRSYLDRQGMAKLMELFKDIDANGDGSISADEWARGVAKSEYELKYFFGGETVAEITQRFRAIDINKDKQISWSEFEKCAREMVKRRHEEGLIELRMLFESIDSDSNGRISSHEWAQAVQQRPELVAKYFGAGTMEQMSRMFKSATPCKHGHAMSCPCPRPCPCPCPWTVVCTSSLCPIPSAAPRSSTHRLPPRPQVLRYEHGRYHRLGRIRGGGARVVRGRAGRARGVRQERKGGQ